ncbi:MAG: S9 family peptidase [Candidatus Marinimicrobia bacterium]|nr:S9 family peptidase [Candidatus Neomarinimicrobiota bacterium]
MAPTKRSSSITHISLLLALLCLTAAGNNLYGKKALQPEDIFRIKYAGSVAISPDGQWAAYTVAISRDVADSAGSRYAELHVVSLATGTSTPLMTGKLNAGTPRWQPGGQTIAFLMHSDQAKKDQVWTIPFDGGEPTQVTDAPEGVKDFQWRPHGRQIAYIAKTPKTEREKALKEKGYGFTYYEENLKHRNLYLIDVGEDGKIGDSKQLTRDVTIWSFVFSPDGNLIAASASEKNLVDYKYAFNHIHLLDLNSGKFTRFTKNPGKLGNFKFSPDGQSVVYTAALTQNDHAVSQVLVQAVNAGVARNLTKPDFKGHVTWAGWKDNRTVVYLAAEGAWNTLNLVPAAGGQREVVLNSREAGITFKGISLSSDFAPLTFIGNWDDVPADVYSWSPGRSPRRLTELNPWLAKRKLGRQEVISYKARDGWEVEGLLYYPVGYKSKKTYPLIVKVHGGPEAHYSYGWNSSYFMPPQVFAGQGYAVFLPNYRASTGYGLAHTKAHFGNPAGTEFDDIADGIRHLIDIRVADAGRVGLGGGSYGGYAAGWFSSYYTDLVKAVAMFVGISDAISKVGGTDIAYEMLYVHFGKKLEDRWQQALERSPIYHAHKSKTAVLIIGGEDDTRVHPSQSLEYYRRLKMNDHPAVRLVQYPGERHGNTKRPGRTDVLYRHLQWFDWYVMDAKPFDGPMPPLDISDTYGLDLK